MAVPKRRHSKARTRSRRANWRASAPNISQCRQCNEPKRPHHVCPSCGYYDGRPAVAVAQDD